MNQTTPTKSESIRAEIARRGLTVEPSGKAWRIYGPNVDFSVADLGFVQAADLKPAGNLISQRKALP